MSVSPSRRWLGVWLGLLGGTLGLLAAAWLPPFVPETVRVVVMEVFASLCHQMPSRSPQVNGVAIAVCDRCAGIYGGLVLGVAGVAAVRPLWRRMGRWGRYVLLGALAGLGVDWVGPVVGLWPNTPVTRVATGALFGVVAGSFAAWRLLRRPSPVSDREEDRKRDRETDRETEATSPAPG